MNRLAIGLLVGAALLTATNLNAAEPGPPPREAGQLTPATKARKAAPTTKARRDPVTTARKQAPSAPRVEPEILGRFDHDPNAFTQGLLFEGGVLYESTGLVGRSSVRIVDLQTGKVLKQRNLPDRLFGEGLAKVGDRLIQLTWRDGIALIYSLPDLQRIGHHRYEGQGWGLCYDGEFLIMSNGSNQLIFRDPDTFAIIRTVEVHDSGRPVRRLNELECVGEHVFANVYQTWDLVKVDKSSGRVVSTIDASKLLPAPERASLAPQAVLNGIAYDPQSRTYLLTGKLWRSIYKVSFP